MSTLPRDINSDLQDQSNRFERAVAEREKSALWNHQIARQVLQEMQNPSRARLAPESKQGSPGLWQRWSQRAAALLLISSLGIGLYWFTTGPATTEDVLVQQDSSTESNWVEDYQSDLLLNASDGESENEELYTLGYIY
ncbi:MAG: hypothetical protein KDK39_05330 [Leptospiraceae bacterium]|nr:hypothetical protein [Leptospiraceae bacterium]